MDQLIRNGLYCHIVVAKLQSKLPESTSILITCGTVSDLVCFLLSNLQQNVKASINKGIVGNCMMKNASKSGKKAV